MTSAIVAGIGQTEFSKDSRRSELQLAAEAARTAIADAGLTPADIDGTVSFVLDRNDEFALLRNLGIPEIRFASRTRGGGGGSASTLQHAAAAVISGAADAVLIYRAFNERSRHRYGQPRGEITGLPWNWYLPFGLDTPAKTYAIGFQRYMARYGVSNRDFGRYAVVARQHAANNPNAWFYGAPITLEDHQASRWIVEPVLRLLDCCQESDGGVALVITRDDRAADLPNPPVRITAATHVQVRGFDELHNLYHPNLAEGEEPAAVARQLWKLSGIGPQDINAAMLYEAFSPHVFLQLEGYGFCGKGEAKDFIADGHIAVGGRLPVNTHGGLLGEAYIHGMNSILEAVRQVRGTSHNQVPDAEHVLMSAGVSAAIVSRL